MKSFLLALLFSLCTCASAVPLKDAADVNVGVFGLADMNNQSARYGVGLLGVCWSAFDYQCFGGAFEAWLSPGNMGPVVGVEVAIISMEPKNRMGKPILNIVWKQGPDNGPWVPSTNINAIGLWFTSQPNTGVPTGIKFQSGFLRPSATEQNPAAIDVTEISSNYIIKGVCGDRLCGIKLGPNGLETHFLNAP